MEVKHRILIEMLIAALKRRDFDLAACLERHKINSFVWEDIYLEAIAHQVHTLLYPVVRNINSESGPDSEIMDQWNKEAMVCGIKSHRDELRIGEVCSTFEEAGIPVIVLKGMAIKKCFPNPELRSMGDADILVHETDLYKAEEILVGMGYEPDKGVNLKHFKFTGMGTVPIELHWLLSEYEFIKKSEVFYKEIWENLLVIPLGNTRASTLSWEMQILHMCIHMGTHFRYKGFGLRQLCDLVMVVETKGYVINWEIVGEKAVEFGLDTFLFAILEVCRKLFRIDIPEVLKCEEIAQSMRIELFINDIFKSGAFGQYDSKRNAINTIVNNISRKEKYFKNKIINGIMILFPSRKKLSGRNDYKYLKKYPFLLPFAWVQRIIYGLKRKDFNFKSKRDIFTDIDLSKLAAERNSLLLWLGLK